MKSPPEPVSQTEFLSDMNGYLSTGIHSLNGWCVPHLWQMIWPLRRFMGEGPVAEIGEFVGKFFIGLCKTFGTSPQNVATAIDVFDMQRFNLDGAGVGRKAVVAANSERFGFSESSVRLIETDSLALRQAEAEPFVADQGRVSFSSVDGCNVVVHTTLDVEFAMEVSRHNDIIAVDDYTNPSWPGLKEAIARIYILRDYPFVPLVVGCNKLLLCNYSYHAQYLDGRSYITGYHTETRIKKVKRFGFDTLTVPPQVQKWSDLVHFSA